MREGLHGLIGKLRPAGTALIVEDVCVPPERIAEGARDLQALLGEHGFLPGVAGHASAGNLHFMLTPDFAKAEDIERYEAFMAKLVELIVGKYDGSLKAEHGTGVNMAPYVEREWGERATELMWRVKRLADPDGVLAPGVVLNRDPGVHLRNLKTTPAIEESATTCVECGFCEPVCPSRNLTTTPRQRIVLRREMARQPPGSPVLRALLEEYEYDALDTCAADGSCQLACPVGIDTGAMVKEQRAELQTPRAEAWALRAAKRWGAVERASRAALRFGGPLARRTHAARACRGRPAGCPPPRAQGAAAVYVPSCTNRIFGGNPVAAMVEVSAPCRPPGLDPRGRRRQLLRAPWSSKGLRRRGRHKHGRWPRSCWRWSDGGALPIVIDAASCTRVGRASPRGLEVLDSVAWAHDRLLPGLRFEARSTPPPSTRPARPATSVSSPRLRALAAALAEDVDVPLERHLLRLRRRPRHHPPGADRGGDRPRGRRARRPRLRRPPLQQPHLRDRPQPRHRRALRVGRLPARAADQELGRLRARGRLGFTHDLRDLRIAAPYGGRRAG